MMENLTLKKICKKCEKEKILDDFYVKPRGKFGRSSECKECFITRVSLLRYGKTEKSGKHQNEFSTMLKNQKHRCLICNQKFTLDFKPCIDHDHKTNFVRGILCNQCNSGLGFFKDDINLLLNSIVYLTNHKNDKQKNVYKGKSVTIDCAKLL